MSCIHSLHKRILFKVVLLDSFKMDQPEYECTSNREIFNSKLEKIPLTFQQWTDKWKNSTAFFPQPYGHFPFRLYLLCEYENP